jgi:hypothetical protein
MFYLMISHIGVVLHCSLLDVWEIISRRKRRSRGWISGVQVREEEARKKRNGGNNNLSKDTYSDDKPLASEQVGWHLAAHET